MSVTLADWQMEVGGVWVGEGTVVDLTSLDTGSHETRSQDVPAVLDDARYFGRDRLTPGTWSLVMSINESSEQAAREVLQTLHTAWGGRKVRETTGAVQTLRYRLTGGTTRRIYGRPRRFTPVLTNLFLGHVPVAYDFALADTAIYEDGEYSISLGVGAANLSGQGMSFPISFPLLWGEPGAAQQRTAHVGGLEPTWLTTRIQGPITDPYVHVGPKMLALRGEIPAGEAVTLRGASWEQGAFWNDGTPAGDMLDPRTRLANLRVEPGSHAVTFGGIDATGTATATVSWRNAYSMI
ncbi:hypothetical protein [Geodermatophilus sp. DSM 45219]|uniref:hypothetical protein n=1 Tax=Geodermatophilus sp. DSM 45219 TaxID=1881103 RepID=UPI0008849FC0|nr:hypothetical protein [Geodermatophilus sp. DSM 45219]SDN79009.1 hypothetical protein SAMN05428965_1635 [Geodermatophilus sp. DSM 45219]